MKRLLSFLPLALILGLAVVISTGCEKEDTTVTKNGLIGEWTLSLTGDINTSIPASVNKVPSSGTGNLSVSGLGVTNYYNLGVSVSETGELNINVLYTDYNVGFIRGWLSKNGTGSGNYRVDFQAGPNEWYSLTGTWTATRN